MPANLTKMFRETFRSGQNVLFVEVDSQCQIDCTVKVTFTCRKCGHNSIVIPDNRQTTPSSPAQDAASKSVLTKNSRLLSMNLPLRLAGKSWRRSSKKLSGVPGSLSSSF